MTSATSSRTSARIGVACGLGAYLIWGTLPLYMQLLRSVPILQIVGHRVLWSLGLMGALILLLGRSRGVLASLRKRRVAAMLFASGVLIGVNWLVYAWAVLNGHVLDASLGYFINPLLNVALGVLVLKERLRPMEKLAVALAAVGVAALAVKGGTALAVPLGLALSFALYGLVRKVVAIEPIGGLAVEMLILSPLAVIWLIQADMAGEAMFGRDTGLDLLLASTCLVTMVPLLLFVEAARRMRYSALGVLQYIAPSLQFLQAVLIFGEKLTTIHLFTFGCIWIALLLYAVDAFRAGRAQPVALPE